MRIPIRDSWPLAVLVSFAILSSSACRNEPAENPRALNAQETLEDEEEPGERSTPGNQEPEEQEDEPPWALDEDEPV
ncbi:MAG: hypothetical protein ACOC0J_02785, partial [Myxococcota bacterium]